AGEYAPLLLSSVAVALALVEAAPALCGGVLALSALPLARRALAGAREKHVRLPQVDIATLFYLVASGQFLAAGLTTWIISAGHWASHRTIAGLRRQIVSELPPEPPAAAVEARARAAWPDWVTERLLAAPLHDTEAQRWAREFDRWSAPPFVAAAGVTYLLS